MSTRASSAPRFDPVELPARIRIAGVEATLRFLEPGDATSLMSFFASHTAETIHQRYGYALTQMTPERAQRLVGVDQTRDAALGVFEPTPQGAVLIAVGRYCLEGNGDAAEVAFVVHEKRRNRGIASLLLRTLAAIASARGVKQLVAVVQHDNTPMLAVFRRTGATLHLVPGGSEFCITLPLPPRATGRPASQANLPASASTATPLP